MIKAHSFHIPVMGIGFTIDTPLKVAHYGIDSVISLGDDILLERLRKLYCNRNKIPYEEITNKTHDFRAKRITSYLNLINKLTHKQFREFKRQATKKRSILKEYLDILPDCSIIQQEFKELLKKVPNTTDLYKWMDKQFSIGSIDVNIMTKIDRETYIKNVKQPIEYNEGHAALRGYANSDLSSSIVLSAGMNPRLYSYIENFKDFYPNENGEIKKKIILKVSDFRSALIQGKFLAKKGLWVSEYRIESGLNCGGHAFATDGFLMGPVLEEFKVKRDELIQNIHEIYIQSPAVKKRFCSKIKLSIKITAQGGVGTADEHQILKDYYQLDSVGWGSPFLLVPEATTVDDVTLNKLVEAREEGLHLSNISPLGVQFNNLKSSTKSKEKTLKTKSGKPGSPCVKKFLALNKEYSTKGLCTASSKYQLLKIKELNQKKLPSQSYQKEYDEIVSKECLCTGLGSSALIVNDLDTKVEGDAVSVCPGPNIAYFSKIMSLKEITNHIYGRINIINRIDRPNMFVKEIKIYMDYLKNKIDKFQVLPTNKQKQKLEKFVQNLDSGISYYDSTFSNSDSGKKLNFNALKDCKKMLHSLHLRLENISIEPPRQNVLA